MKVDILMEFERTIRIAKGSKVIAVPNEILQVLKATDDKKLKYTITKNGDVKLEKVEVKDV